MKKTLHLIAILLMTVVTVSLNTSCKKDGEKDKDKEEEITTKDPIMRDVYVDGTGSVEFPTRRYYSLETGAEVSATDANTKKWDISFERLNIHINSNFGAVGQVIYGINFPYITIAPETGYKKDGEFPLDEWYDYESVTGKIIPKENVYIIRTTSGKYVKLQILNFYSESEQAGHYTFRYTIQPGGSREFVK